MCSTDKKGKRYKRETLLDTNTGRGTAGTKVSEFESLVCMRTLRYELELERGMHGMTSHAMRKQENRSVVLSWLSK